jgi:four helix bundle protein
MGNSELRMARQARGDDLSDRLLAFAVRIFKLIKALPKDSYSRHVGLQLFKASTSTGANCEEARGAGSRDDFVHKMGVVWKEVKESRFWLRFVYRAELVAPERVEPLLKEAEELCKIFGSSIKTARTRGVGKR